MHNLLKYQKIRFVIAGVFNTTLDFFILNCLVFLFSYNTLNANSVSVTIGITMSYIINHHFVFRQSTKKSVKKYLTFFAVTGFSSLILQNLIIYGSEKLIGTNFGHSLLIIGDLAENKALELNIAKTLAVAVGMVWNFAIYKRLVFDNNEKNSDSTDKILL